MYYFIRIVAVYLLIFAGGINANPEMFRLNTGAPESLSNRSGTGFYNKIASEIFKRLKIKLEYIQLPSQRSLIQANMGVDDGNFARVKGLTAKWPNLIIVPESIIVWEFSVFSLKKNIKIEGWHSLKPHSVGYVHGWQIYKKRTKNLKRVISTSNPSQLFRLLKNGRIDLALFESQQSSYWIKKTGVAALKLSPALAKKPLYIYVHKKHKNLVPKIVQVIKDMKKDGTYRRIYKQSFSQPWKK